MGLWAVVNNLPIFPPQLPPLHWPKTGFRLHFLHPDAARLRDLRQACRESRSAIVQALPDRTSVRLSAALRDLPGPLTRSTLTVTIRAPREPGQWTRPAREACGAAFVQALAGLGHEAGLAP